MFLICPTCKTKYKLKDKGSINYRQKVVCLNCKQKWIIYENFEEYFLEFFKNKTEDNLESLDLRSNKSTSLKTDITLKELVKSEIRSFKKQIENNENDYHFDKFTAAGFITVSLIFIFGILIYENEDFVKKFFLNNSESIDLYINFINTAKKNLFDILNI